MCKEDTLRRSANLFSRVHPTLSFWLRVCPVLNVYLSNWQKQSPAVCSIKEAVLKNFEILTGKHLLESLVDKAANLKPAALVNRDFKSGVFLQQIFCETSILKNIYVRLLLKWLYEVTVWNFVSGLSLSRPSWLSIVFLLI